MAVVRVKICGLTDPAQAVAACNAGADAIGLVFYPPSSRFVTNQQAAEIAAAIPPFCQRVGLFVDASREEVLAVLSEVELDLLQFHGKETVEYCESFAKPYIKVFAMNPEENIEKKLVEFQSARGFLLDAYHPKKPGGTGEVFDWQTFPRQSQKPLILAGGLTCENVQRAVNICQPYAVDVSGGVESAPGQKAIKKISEFIRQAKSIEVTL